MTSSSNENQRPKNQPVGYWGRLLSSPTLWLAIIILGVGLPLGRNLLRPQVQPPPSYGVLPEIELVDQDQKKLKISSLQGSVLLVNFIFTRCPGTCPMLSAQMAKVQKRIAGSGSAVRLLSITVDPEYDTPEVLKTYAEKFGAKRSMWLFVTGPLPEIEKALVQGFKVFSDKASEVTNLMEFTHAENFVLVDQAGQIRGYRTLNNSSDIDKVLKEIAVIANTNPSSAPQKTGSVQSLAR